VNLAKKSCVCSVAVSNATRSCARPEKEHSTTASCRAGPTASNARKKKKRAFMQIAPLTWIRPRTSEPRQRPLDPLEQQAADLLVFQAGKWKFKNMAAAPPADHRPAALPPPAPYPDSPVPMVVSDIPAATQPAPAPPTATAMPALNGAAPKVRTPPLPSPHQTPPSVAAQWSAAPPRQQGPDAVLPPPMEQWAPHVAPQPQPQPALAPTQRQTPDPRIAKPHIMDPPGNHVPSATFQHTGLPSPTIDHAKENAKFSDDVARITYGLHQSLPEAVRRVVRDNWEKCLLGSEFHQAFVVSLISVCLVECCRGRFYGCKRQGMRVKCKVDFVETRFGR
jgi:hypothetical protein